MIHFDFVVTDDEALEIFECLNRTVAEILESKMDDMWKNNSEYCEYFDSRIAFIKELKTKMKNSQVE